MADQPVFDFKAHEQQAVAAYLQRHVFYQDLAVVVQRILEECLKRRGTSVHSVQARAKDPASLGRKAALPAEADPSRPKYPTPLAQITDLTAARVIAYFPSALTEIDELLHEEFRIVERSDKGAELLEEERFGYQSIHYLVTLSGVRAQLPEYEAFARTVVEVQVRTILQHAWAEIEHDIQYKSAEVIPTEIRRRFMALAGLLEIADREFQGIQDADKKLRIEARARVEGGQLGDVEITPDALKAFLDKRLGPDGRISELSYDWTARLLRKLGFTTLEQVEKCIREYDDDTVSRVASGSRQGQTTRFEQMLLAGMGESYLQRHLFAGLPWWGRAERQYLENFKAKGVPVREFDPLADSTRAAPHAASTAAED